MIDVDRIKISPIWLSSQSWRKRALECDTFRFYPTRKAECLVIADALEELESLREPKIAEYQPCGCRYKNGFLYQCCGKHPPGELLETAYYSHPVLEALRTAYFEQKRQVAREQQALKQSQSAVDLLTAKVRDLTAELREPQQRFIDEIAGLKAQVALLKSQVEVYGNQIDFYKGFAARERDRRIRARKYIGKLHRMLRIFDPLEIPQSLQQKAGTHEAQDQVPVSN